MTLAILALLAGACGNGDGNITEDCVNCDVTEPTDTTDDCCSSTDPVEEIGSLTVNVTVLGADVNCDVNVYDSADAFVGTFDVGSEIELALGNNTLTLGDVGEPRDASDELPLHSEGEVPWISPELKVTLDDNTVIDAPMNMFIEGEWTCEKTSTSTTVATGTIEYQDGYLVGLPGLSDEMEVEGMTISHDDSTSYSGEFVDSTYISLEWWDTADRSGTAECWKGDGNDRPTG